MLKNKKFIPRIKPLQRCPESEVEIYAGLIFPKIRFGHQCPYRKEVLRLHVKKMIDYLEKKHPGIKYQIFEGNKRIRAALMKSVEIGKPNNCRICGEICSGDICQACEFRQKLERTE